MSKRSQAKLAKSYTAKAVAVSEPVEWKAEASEGEGAGGPKQFSGIGYSGGRLPGYTVTPKLDLPYVIDLASTGRARNVHANLDHKTTQRVGHLSEVDNDGKRIAVGGVLSAATSHRDEVANGSKDGQPWELSGEFALGKRSLVKAGETAVVNGQKFTGPLYRFVNNTFTDIAFVSHGADGGNEVKIAASTAGELEMNEFEKFMARCGVDHETATDEQKAALKEAFDASTKAKADGSGNPNYKTFADSVEEQKANRDRCAAISKLAADSMKMHPIYIEQIEGMAKLAMDGDTTLRDFELELLRALRTTTGAFTGRSSRPEADPLLIEAAICMASGLPKIEDHYSEEVLDRVERAGMRNFGVQQLLLQTANANGYSCRAGERIHNGNIREILEFCFPPVHARLTGFSAISLTGILGNVANKEILTGYMEEDNTWREIAQIKPVNNFYAVTSYRMLDSLEYEEIGPTGTIKHGTLDQESYTRQAKTYAKMLGLTRNDIINDDLGAFDDIRTRLGRGAAKKFNNIFWAAFLNNASFFTTGLTNYLAGATTNLGADGVGLGLGQLTYRKMTSPATDGTKRIGASISRASILLAPPEVEVIAQGLYQSRNLVTGASATITGDNVFAGLYRPVIQNRLSDSAFTGYSTTAWYLFGNELKPMVVSFLNGQQTPTVESADADFNQLGIQFRGFHDFGADKSEYLAGVKLKGAA
jgi:hypothetical protein